MRLALSAALFVAAAVGIALYLIQLASTWRHLRAARRFAIDKNRLPGVSILKPLCGLDDDLAANLERFATLSYPRYELLLGVRSTADSAWPLAVAAARRHPGRVRVVVQRGEPGLNPKVNQLITLAAAARHELVVVSDSNVRVPDGYLEEIAAHLAAPDVGLVTHAVVGVGERRLGSLLDNLHMGSSVGPGMIGAKRVARRDLVVGKSMALRVSDLARLGGFAAVKDVLAEDFVMGRLVARALGKRVVVAHRPVYNVSRERAVRDFLHRYRRWAVIHRKAIGGPLYLAQLALNPTVVALGAAATRPTAGALALAGALATTKALYDLAAVRTLRAEALPARALVAAPLKDLVLGWAWLHGLVSSTVVWRDSRLRVLPGTRLDAPPPAAPPPAAALDAEGA
jgi:ceramide glucosyltransferase